MPGHAPNVFLKRAVIITEKLANGNMVCPQTMRSKPKTHLFPVLQFQRNSFNQINIWAITSFILVFYTKSLKLSENNSLLVFVLKTQKEKKIPTTLGVLGKKIHITR